MMPPYTTRKKEEEPTYFGYTKKEEEEAWRVYRWATWLQIEEEWAKRRGKEVDEKTILYHEKEIYGNERALERAAERAKRKSERPVTEKVVDAVTTDTEIKLGCCVIPTAAFLVTAALCLYSSTPKEDQLEIQPPAQVQIVNPQTQEPQVEK